MHLNWNKSFSRVVVSAVAVMLATTSLNAIPRDPCEPPPEPVCCEEPRPGPFAFSYPFDMDLNCPRDFYFHVDGLAMQAKEDGLDFVIRDSSAAASNSAITEGRVIGFSSDNSDFDYNPGVRVGLGFFLDHDAWNLDLAWTWLNITNYRNGHIGTGGGIVIPEWALGIGTPANQFGSRSSAKWNADYNTIDVRLAKPYYVSRYLVLNPHFGARAGWIDQQFSVDYGGVPSNPTNRTVFHSENDFWGVGARAGLDSCWILGKGWSLFGNIAASMIFGKFDVTQNYHLPAAQNTDGYNLTHSFYQNVPNMEIALGIAWGYYFNKKRNHVELKAGYEFHEWFDQLQLRKFFSGAQSVPVAGTPVTTGVYAGDTVSRGNLTLNGFSLALRFDI